MYVQLTLACRVGNEVKLVVDILFSVFFLNNIYIINVVNIFVNWLRPKVWKTYFTAQNGIGFH